MKNEARVAVWVEIRTRDLWYTKQGCHSLDRDVV